MTEQSEITTGPAMIDNRSPTLPSSIRGQLLRLSEHRAVAIYLREGSTWVADFVDGQGVLVDVNTWFRFNCGTLGNSHASRRVILESALPLSAELIQRIEALHAATATSDSVAEGVPHIGTIGRRWAAVRRSFEAPRRLLRRMLE